MIEKTRSKSDVEMRTLDTHDCARARKENERARARLGEGARMRDLGRRVRVSRNRARCLRQRKLTWSRRAMGVSVSGGDVEEREKGRERRGEREREGEHGER